VGNNYHTPWQDQVTHYSAAEMCIPLGHLDRALTYNKPAIVSCDGEIAWDNTTGVLSWTGPLRIVFNREDGVAVQNTVATGNLTLLDNQFALATLDDTNDTAITLAATTLNPGSVSNFLAYNAFVLAYKNATSNNLSTIGLPPIAKDTTTSDATFEVAVVIASRRVSRDAAPSLATTP